MLEERTFFDLKLRMAVERISYALCPPGINCPYEGRGGKPPSKPPVGPQTAAKRCVSCTNDWLDRMVGVVEDRQLFVEEVIEMNSAPLETSIVDKIMGWLKKVPGCKVEKRHGYSYAGAGKPDLTGAIRGRRFEMEVKRPGCNPTKLQEREIAAWKKAGVAAGVVRSLDDAKKLLVEEGLLSADESKNIGAEEEERRKKLKQKKIVPQPLLP